MSVEVGVWYSMLPVFNIEAFFWEQKLLTPTPYFF